MMGHSNIQKSEERLGGQQLKAMFACALRLLEDNADSIDRLNVFPVPDGDTGTNMVLTLRGMMSEADTLQSDSAGEVASVMSRAAMMASRGNSGLILSQLFKGMADAFENKPDAGPEELASALELGKDHAYSVLGNPVEGTILTVFTSAAQAARESAESGGDIQDLLLAVCDAAQEAVAQTPTLLPRLRDAGVVDAGGLGLSVILDGLRLYLSGEDLEAYETPVPVTAGTGASVSRVSSDFLDATDEEIYGRCTQFVIEGRDLDPEQVRQHMNVRARSTVVIGDETLLKVHVHTDDPDEIMSYARSLGNVSHLDIHDMDEQHRHFADTWREAAAATPSRDEELPIAVVAVAWGKGLEALFAEQGAEVLVAGDTMNPSVQEIITAVEKAPSEKVIFLPNNRNIVPAARQASEFIHKELAVIPTTSIPQGIASLLEFIPDSGFEENVARMGSAPSSVRTGEVCEAVRAVELEDVSAQEGQIIGLMERELLVSGDDPISVLISLLRKAEASEAELITLYWGGPLTEEQATEALEQTRTAFPDAEVELVPGGQPHYHFIVSIE